MPPRKGLSPKHVEILRLAARPEGVTRNQICDVQICAISVCNDRLQKLVKESFLYLSEPGRSRNPAVYRTTRIGDDRVRLENRIEDAIEAKIASRQGE